jgi:hypothetical protein
MRNASSPKGKLKKQVIIITHLDNVVPCALHMRMHPASIQSETATVHIPTLQRKQFRHQDTQWLAQGHSITKETEVEPGSRSRTQVRLCCGTQLIDSTS